MDFHFVPAPVGPELEPDDDWSLKDLMPDAVFKDAAKAVFGGGLIGTVLSMFSGDDKEPAPVAPAIPEPKVMPVADDDASRRAAKKKVAQRQAISSRASTFLSDIGSQPLGGG